MIIESIEIIPNNNSFQFNNINYIQSLGTAMGTKMAPIYATLTLVYLEENLYEIIGKKYSNDYKRIIYQIMEKIFRWLIHILEMLMGIQRKLKNSKKHNNEKPLAYDATYNKNSPELSTDQWKI